MASCGKEFHSLLMFFMWKSTITILRNKECAFPITSSRNWRFYQEESCSPRTSFLSSFYLASSHMETFPEIGSLPLHFLNLVCRVFLSWGQEIHTIFKMWTCYRLLSYTSYSVLSQNFLQLWICVGTQKWKKTYNCSPT